jgi:hypothetical protein
MKTLFTFLLACLASTPCLLANPGQPVAHHFSRSFIDNLKKAEGVLDLRSPGSSKICACQLLKVASNNAPDQLIAVFAQATNNGDLSFDFSLAQTVLQKEKKHIQDLFFSKVKVQENLTAVYDCSLMYKNIKLKYDEVKMYDVLDVDVLTRLAMKNRR